ncbi:hypothetical protein Hanom_Chr09g00765421 [Helianthus anomalus]
MKRAIANAMFAIDNYACGLHFVTYLIPNFCQKYTNCPCRMHFVTHLVTKRWGLNALQSAYDRNHLCTFGKSWELNMLKRGKHHSCTFEKLGTQSKILVNQRDHACTLL